MPIVRKPLDLSRVTVVDLAYAAGIIDGEGCLMIARQSYRKGYPENYWPRVEVGTIDTVLCPWLYETFGGNMYSKDVAYNFKSVPTWKWSVSHAQLYDFLTAIRPYLKLKADVADVLLSYRATIGVPGKNITEETRAIRRGFYESVKSLRVKSRKAA